MITETERQNPVTLMVPPTEEDHLEISRLLAAATVNPSFCHTLLVDPKRAIEDGYFGETFHLSDAGRYLLLFIHADSLADLARQILQALGLGMQSQSLLLAPAREFVGY
jgi:hypothetical protein